MADEHYEKLSDDELSELLDQAQYSYDSAKPEFLQHQREFQALQSRKGRIQREIKRREAIVDLPTRPGYYRDVSGDFYILDAEKGWSDAWGGLDLPGRYDLPLTWIGNEE